MLLTRAKNAKIKVVDGPASHLLQKEPFATIECNRASAIMDVLQHLDRHLIYPILEFYQANGLHSEKEMLQAKFDLLQDTNMPGHCAELYKQIHGTEEVPSSFEERQSAIDRQLVELEASSQKVLEVLEKPDLASALRQDKSQNLVYLRDSYGIDIEDIDVLYKLGQFDYNRGNYSGAVEHLYHFKILSPNQNMITTATWGKLASEILTANWDDATQELQKLKEQVDADSDDSLVQFRNRTWLLHWALFPLFKSGTIKATELLDLYFVAAHLNVIQTAAPHLLRYLTIAVLMTSFGKASAGTPNRRLRDLIRLLDFDNQQQDPIVKFATAIFSHYDFSTAASYLPEIQKAIAADYFLADSSDIIIKSLKIAVAEAYLRLHTITEIQKIADLLDLSSDDAIALVSEELEHLDTDVDRDEGIIEVLKDHQQTNLQELVNKTKSLMNRSATAQRAIPKLVR